MSMHTYSGCLSPLVPAPAPSPDPVAHRRLATSCGRVRCPMPVQPVSCWVPHDPLTTGAHPHAAHAILQWRRQASTGAAHHAVHTYNCALGAGGSEQRGRRIPGHAGHGPAVRLNLTQHVAPRGGGVDHAQRAPGLGRREGQKGGVGGGAQRTAALHGSHASSQTNDSISGASRGMRPAGRLHPARGARRCVAFAPTALQSRALQS